MPEEWEEATTNSFVDADGVKWVREEPTPKMRVIDGPNPLGLKIGDQLRDNDARSEGRIITIGGFYHYHLGGRWFFWYLGSGGKKHRVAFERVYVDGRPHSQGYTLVK